MIEISNKLIKVSALNLVEQIMIKTLACIATVEKKIGIDFMLMKVVQSLFFHTCQSRTDVFIYRRFVSFKTSSEMQIILIKSHVIKLCFERLISGAYSISFFRNLSRLSLYYALMCLHSYNDPFDRLFFFEMSLSLFTRF